MSEALLLPEQCLLFLMMKLDLCFSSSLFIFSLPRCEFEYILHLLLLGSCCKLCTETLQIFFDGVLPLDVQNTLLGLEFNSLEILFLLP